MMRTLAMAAVAIGAFSLPAQEPPPDAERAGLIPSEEIPADAVLLPRGTRVPLALINSVSTRNAAPGDKVYLMSVFPVAVEGRILVPAGSYVTGSVTEVKRPGRVKGRGELRLKFEQMILQNGVIRDFTGSVAALDGMPDEKLDRETGEVKSSGGQGDDPHDVAQATQTGAAIGTIAGAASGRPLSGLGMGSASGAAAGLIGVLLTRGPDALLERGSQVEMVLDRDLTFTDEEMTFANPLQQPVIPAQQGPANDDRRNDGGLLGLPPFFYRS